MSNVLEEEDDKAGSPKRRKPTAKKTFSFDDFKKEFTGDLSINDKPLQWINLSPAFQAETGLPGVPMGYTTLFRGFGNTGKSTGLVEAIVSAQKDGQFIIIVDTEGNLGKHHLETMGFDQKLPHFYFNNEDLRENFGKKKNPEIGQGSIEDLADLVDNMIDAQQLEGKISQNVLFAIDSIGTIDCIKTIKGLEGDGGENNMFNAAALEKRFKSILNNRVPASRKENKPFYFTLAAVQKIWYDGMNNVIKHKGGEAFAYGARLIYHHGGILTPGTKKIVATSKKRDVSFGIECKVGVVKNQIDGPMGGLGFEGKLISTPHGFIRADDESKKEYKQKHMLFFRNKLGASDTDDIDMKSEDLTKDEELSFLNND